MKKLSVFILCSLLSTCLFAQLKKGGMGKPTKETTHKADIDTAKHQLGSDIPNGTTVFVLSQDQVHLLEYVISKTDAGFEKTQELIRILKTQQYNPGLVATGSVKADSTGHLKKDTTAVHK